MKGKIGSFLTILLLLIIGALLLTIGSDVVEIKEMIASKDRINRGENAMLPPQNPNAASTYAGEGVYVNLQKGSLYHSSKRCVILEHFEYETCTSVTIIGVTVFDPDLLTNMSTYEAEYRGFDPCPSCRNAYNKADAIYDIVYDKLY